MKVCGFTFIRNAIKYDYPIKEAIMSVLPLCDEFIVLLGNCNDGTRELLESISSEKIKIIDSIWDETLKEGGKVLADETNKAIKELPKDADWALYIQGDEILHEKYINEVKHNMIKYKDDKNVEGLLFGYKHFYGSYDYIGISSNWYRREIRIIRPNCNIYSYKDAQGFRKGENEKLNVKLIDAEIYHYGWVRPPKAMYEKHNNFIRLYNNAEIYVEGKDFDYSNIDALDAFKGTHPRVMRKRIESKNWKFIHDISKNKFSFKNFLKNIFKKYLNIYIWEYRNYKIIK